MTLPDVRWKEISRLYAEALAYPRDRRTAFLVEACSDPELRHEVDRLLASGSQADERGFLDEPTVAGHVRTADASPMSLVGRQLGAYRIDAPLGAGGMGEVYRATDTRLYRSVAVKILPRHLRDDPELRERFEREARAVAALRHPNICVLYDIGQEAGVDFLVMELLEGGTLADRLRERPLDREALFQTAIGIADALVETHRQGIVHGDLKPANIMLTASGAKLLDFGLARLLPAASLRGDVMRDAAASGPLAGTLPYMAPEQLRRERVDSGIDVFAFGAVLYEMLTGGKAFDASTSGDMVADQLTLRRTLPAPPARGEPWAQAAWPLIARCLAPEPEARWSRTIDLADELRRLWVVYGAARPPYHAATHGRRWWLAATTIAGMAIAWVVWGTSPIPRVDKSGPVSASDDRATAATPLRLGSMRQLTADDRLEVDPSFSPDGASVAYAAGTATRMRIFIRSIRGGRAVPLTREDGLQFHPRWSPDGRFVLYVTPGGAFVAPVGGDGTARRVDSEADRAGAYSAATPTTARRIFSSAVWSADGRRIALAYGGTLWSVPADGPGERRLLATSPYELHSCDWSPRGRWVACVAGNWSFAGPGGYFGNISPSAIVLLSTDALAGPREIVDRQFVNRSPVWSADGARLYFLSNREGPSDVYAFDVTNEGAVRGEPRRITTGLGAYAMALTRDQRRLAYASYSARSNIFSLPIPRAGTIDASGARAVTSGNQTIEAMRVSRDGRWLLYDSNSQGNFDIFRVPTDGAGGVEQLTTAGSDEFAPDLSPDGRLLAYHSWRTKSRDIFIQPLTGGAPEQVTTTASQESLPAWSPDGRALVFLDQSVENGMTRGAFLVSRERQGTWGTPSSLMAGTARPSWLPDGQSVVYARRGGIEVLSLATRSARTLYEPARGGVDPVVGTVQVGMDGQDLYFKSHDALGMASIWSLPVSGGRPRELVRFSDPARPSSRTEFAVARERLYFTIEDRRSNIWVTDIISGDRP